MSRGRRVLPLLVLAAVLLLAARPMAAPVAIKVGSSQTLGEAGLYLALEKGYFREESLDVEIVPMQVGADAITTLAGGHIDVAVTAIESGLFNAAGRGIPVRIVAGAGYSLAALVARKALVDGGTLKAFGDLKGRTVALPSPVSAHHIVVEIGAERAGLARDDVQLAYLSFPNMVTALSTGKVDVAYLPEPFAARAVETGVGARWIDPNQLRPNTLVTAWLYAERLLEREPDAGQRFMVALLRGTRDYVNAVERNQGRPAAVAAMIKHTRIKEPALYERMTFPRVAPSGEIRMASLQETLDWFRARGIVKSPVDLAQVVDQRFTTAAVKRLGPLP